MRNCQKCGQVNPTADQTDTAACPNCGAIYARVEAAIAAGNFRPIAKRVAPVESDSLPPRPAIAVTTPTTITPALFNSIQPTQASDKPFIETLREGSQYPTFRGLVRLSTVVGYVIWGLGGSVAFTVGLASKNIAPAFGAAFMAILMIVITRVTKEAFLMLADLSDAAVVAAEKLSGRGR